MGLPLFILCSCLSLVLAVPSPSNGTWSSLPTWTPTPVTPVVKGTPSVVGLVNDPHLDRDSCGSSTRFGSRTLWTCRDTQPYTRNGSVNTNTTIASSASWSDYRADGNPAFRPVPDDVNPIDYTILEQYGNNSFKQAFFPYLKDECSPPAGDCGNGTRYALWPDLPPLVTDMSWAYPVTAYNWIRKQHINNDFTADPPYPPTTLYKVTYDPAVEGVGDELPEVSVVEENFWGLNEYPYGDYGNVILDGIAYLYAYTNSVTALAKVPVESIEDKSAYEYWVNSTWTTERPTFDTPNVNIENANVGGQGTYYYSWVWQSYVWIGGSEFPGANAFVTTAPEPQGPWIEPFQIFSAPGGNYSLSAYSIQANPALTLWQNPNNNSIYVSYTKNDLNGQNVNVYHTVLVYVDWEN